MQDASAFVSRKIPISSVGSKSGFHRLIAPPPKSVHKYHHVVPVGWQRKFAAPNEVGPFYKNVLTGGLTGAVGPGHKMSEQYANIVFDEHYRPTDSLEDRLGKIETKAFPALERLISTPSLDGEGRVRTAIPAVNNVASLV